MHALVQFFFRFIFKIYYPRFVYNFISFAHERTMDDEIDALPAAGVAAEARGMFERGQVGGAEHARKNKWREDEGLPQVGAAAASRAAFQEAASKQVC